MGWVVNATPAVDAESQWRTIIPICLVLSTLSILVVSSRLWIRAGTRGHLAADDLMAALSMVFALTYSILCIVQTKFGLGLPIKLRPKANLVPYTRVNFAGRPIYQMGISFFKIALCISYLRLLKGTDQRRYRIVVWTVITLIFLGHVGCTLCLIFACKPVDKSWNPLKKGTCLPVGPAFTGYAMVTIVSDVVVAILPIPVLLKLNVRTSKKVGLIIIFLLGLFTTVCSVLRYSQINRIQHGDGNSTMLILWGTIEFNVGNMVSSLPFLAPVFLRKAREYRSKNSSDNNGKGGVNSGEAVAGGDTEAIRLSERSHKKNSISKKKNLLYGSTIASSSEDNILRPVQSHAIVKSLSYSIRVDDAFDHHPPRQDNIV